MAKIINKTKVITGPRTRWSYANVWDPKSINGGTPKYSVSLIIPKSDKKTVEAIKAAIQAAYEEGVSKLRATARRFPPSRSSRPRCVTAMRNAPMIRSMRMPTSSTPIPLPPPASWMRT